MGRSIPPLQQLPHGLIENRIAPQRQHITHGKHITHDNQHINKQHEHQPIGEAMTNHHAEDGDKKAFWMPALSEHMQTNMTPPLPPRP